MASFQSQKKTRPFPKWGVINRQANANSQRSSPKTTPGCFALVSTKIGVFLTRMGRVLRFLRFFWGYLTSFDRRHPGRSLRFEAPRADRCGAYASAPCQQARPKSASSAETPLQPHGRPSPALTTRPTPLLEGALLVAIRADPRASKPHELPVAVPKREPLSTGTADVSQ